jgi:HMG (high mobility group) box
MEAMKEIGRTWHQMGPSDKEPFVRLAREEKERRQEEARIQAQQGETASGNPDGGAAGGWERANTGVTASETAADAVGSPSSGGSEDD